MAHHLGNEATSVVWSGVCNDLIHRPRHREHFDDTKKYVDTCRNLSEEDYHKIFEGNAGSIRAAMRCSKSAASQVRREPRTFPREQAILPTG